MFRKKKLLAGIIMMTALCILAPVTGAKAEDNSYTDDNGTYTVTIPAEVTIPETTYTSEIPIKVKLKQNTNLVINVASANDFKLINTESSSENGKIAYSISDKKPLVFSNSGSTESETTYNLKVALTQKSFLYSGTYADQLTFTMTSAAHENTTNYHLNFDVNADTDSVSITTTQKVLKQGEEYGTLPTPVRTGYTFEGWYNSKDDQSDKNKVTEKTTMGTEDVQLYAKWTVHKFKNTVTFWAWGFKNQEGNNNPGTALRLGMNHTMEKETAYNTEYTFTTKIASDCGIEVPKGYQLKQFGSATISTAKWARYNFVNGSYTGIQPDWVVNAEYEYDPIDYTITYVLDGGTNSENNPSTYTVLYGVTFADPTKEGYTFEGWYDADNKKITGINENCVNSFKTVTENSDEAYAAAAENFYNTLKNRTIGNITVKAKWIENDAVSNTDSNNSDMELNVPDEETVTE